MKIRQLRNATLLIEYADKKFLVDPMLAEKGAYPGFPGTVNSHLSNPLVELPVALDEILQVDAVVVTHTHPDHLDEAAKSLVPKELLIYAQNEKDAAEIRSAGFSNVQILTESTEFDGIAISKTPGQHGSDAAYAAIGEILGEVCGVVFKHSDEGTLYLAGDTIWNHFVEETLKKYEPNVIVVNCGDAQAIGVGSCIMGKQDVYEVCKSSPEATVVASHMEAVNHCLLSRTELQEFADKSGIAAQLIIPLDGETLTC